MITNMVSMSESIPVALRLEIENIETGYDVLNIYYKTET